MNRFGLRLGTRAVVASSRRQVRSSIAAAAATHLFAPHTISSSSSSRMLRALSTQSMFSPVRASSSSPSLMTTRSMSSGGGGGNVIEESFDESGLVVVRTDTDTRIVTIELNLPSKMNMMTVAMGEAFETTITALCRRDLAAPEAEQMRAVILTGAGPRAFSAGGDLDFIFERANATALENSETMRKFYDRFLSVRRLPVPVIAAINGAAVGAGMCVACACDMRVALSSAKIGFTFVDLGIHPGMGSTHFLPQLVGHERAFKLLATGEMTTGADAHAMGLVCEVVNADADADAATNAAAVVERATELALKMTCKASTTVRTLARSMRLRHEQDLDRALWREADAQAQCYAAPAFKPSLEAVRDRVQSSKKAKK